MTKYTKNMSGGELLAHMGTDASKWTDEFMRVQADPTAGPQDWGAMVGWFANAIEAGRTAGMQATCPHINTARYGDDLVLCHTCGASV